MIFHGDHIHRAKLHDCFTKNAQRKPVRRQLRTVQDPIYLFQRKRIIEVPVPAKLTPYLWDTNPRQRFFPPLF